MQASLCAYMDAVNVYDFTFDKYYVGTKKGEQCIQYKVGFFSLSIYILFF